MLEPDEIARVVGRAASLPWSAGTCIQLGKLAARPTA